jgi:hypothetical protein
MLYDNAKTTIKEAEQLLEDDSFYNDLKAKKDFHGALAYKYGLITMNLALQIEELKK